MIILEGDNTVKSFAAPHAGIEVIKNYTLRIKGNGSLKAYSNGYGSGIGGRGACGNIIIESGNITAEGDTGIGACGILPSGNITILGGTVNAKVIPGGHGAGIGSGQDGICGNILIRGGIVNVDTSESGNEEGAGIGSGAFSTCGDITITKGVTKVTVTCRGSSGTARTIGPGFEGKCGLVNIGGDEG